MLTLLGSLLGFATSAIPDIMSLFRERADRKHELAVLDRQMEQMRLGHTSASRRSRSRPTSPRARRSTSTMQRWAAAADGWTACAPRSAR